MSIRIDGTNTTANPGITGGDADTGLQFGTDEISFVTGGTNRATVESNGNFTIENGNLVLASGRGIDFSATADGSGTMTSELLDDYEEGTWTPVDSGGDQFTLGKAATYTKVGRVVYLSFDITGNANASGFAVYGLPFGALNVTSEGGNFCFYPGYTAGINQDVFGHTGPDNVTLFVATANETVHNGDRLIMSGWYFTNE